MRFRDRAEAGRLLAGELRHLRDANVVVLALPRGGVPVAAEVAGALDAPLDVILVRKLGVPRHEELAFGAVASGGVRVLIDAVLAEVRSTRRRSTPRPPPRRGSSNGRRSATAGAGPHSTCAIAASSSSTTGSRRAPRCAPRRVRCTSSEHNT